MGARAALGLLARSCPAGLLGMIGLMVLIESGVGRLGDGLAPYPALGARFSATAAGQEAVKASVLVLGDSVMKFGFDPAAFDNGHGGDTLAYNLAVPGTPPLMAESILRRALAAGARPKAVVVGYMTLSGNPKVHFNDFAEAFSTADAFRMARDGRDPSWFLGVMTAKLLPTLRYRGALRAGALASLEGRPTTPGGSVAPGVPGPLAAASDLKRWAEARGAALHPPDGRFNGRMEPELERRLYSEKWLVHPVLAKSFRRLCDLAASRGARVAFVVAPLAPDAQARRDALGLDPPHTRNLRALLSKVPNAIVLDARHAGYSVSDFFDSCHLNAQGAARLSREVGAALARVANGPRSAGLVWVDLRGPAEGPESRVAVGEREDAKPR